MSMHYPPPSMTAGTMSCNKCGRGGLYSVTYINGEPTCVYCVAEMSPKDIAHPPAPLDPQIARALLDMQSSLAELRDMLAVVVAKMDKLK